MKDFDIFTLDESTGIVRRLTSYDRNVYPTWSPDGTRIAFTRSDSSWQSSDIWIMNDDGSGATPVATGSAFSSPAWSPVGDALVFSSGDCIYNCDIYVQSLADGSGRRHLATSAAFPAWSPDGSRIAFVALSGDDGYHSLRLVDPDGRNNTLLTPIDEGNIGGPAWSPDGTLIAFKKCMSGCDNPCRAP